MPKEKKKGRSTGIFKTALLGSAIGVGIAAGLNSRGQDRRMADMEKLFNEFNSIVTDRNNFENKAKLKKEAKVRLERISESFNRLQNAYDSHARDRPKHAVLGAGLGFLVGATRGSRRAGFLKKRQRKGKDDFIS